jgi:hypothetical protein
LKPAITVKVNRLLIIMNLYSLKNMKDCEAEGWVQLEDEEVDEK